MPCAAHVSSWAIEEPTVLDVLPKSWAHFSSCMSNRNTSIIVIVTIPVNSYISQNMVLCAVLTVSPGRGLSWPSITDILASWSSLLSVWTVLRAESISRGPHASWAFKQHTQKCNSRSCSRYAGCNPILVSLNGIKVKLSWLSGALIKQYLTTYFPPWWDESYYLYLYLYLKILSIGTFWVAVLSSARQVAKFFAHWPNCIAAAWSATVGTADFADVTILLPG